VTTYGAGPGKFSILGFDFARDDTEDGTWTDLHVREEDLTAAVRAAGGGGEDAGNLLIRLSVDGQFNQVLMDTGSSSDVDALSCAIDTLTEAREKLLELYGDRPRRAGWCMTYGQEGRCLERGDHDGEHRFQSPAPIKAVGA
jgi:hypothetical protein